jgi:hypothetical protein
VQIGEGAWNSINYSGEVLAGQGEMGVRIDTVGRLWYRPSLCGWSTLYVVFLYAFAAISDDAPAVGWCVVLAVVLGYD